MTRCLYCGRIIKDTASETEQRNRWHSRCIRAFFGTAEMPELDVTEEELKEIAEKTVDRGLTVPGVQKKLSLHLSEESGTRLTIVDYPTGYILKPQTEEYPFLPEYEHAAMRLAEKAGIKTAPFALIRTADSYAYITKRVDREFRNDEVRKYAMEDFCQLSGKLTRDKYLGSYENCGRIIKKYSSQAGLDLSELFMRIVFSFVIGNSDMHLKNFSLREKEPGSREFFLSEAYDLLPVSLVLPEDSEQTALTLNGKKNNLRKKDFMKFAENCGIAETAAARMIKKICSLQDRLIENCRYSELPDEQKNDLTGLVVNRIKVLDSAGG